MVMWSLQDSSYRSNALLWQNQGIIEGWHGDGNFARTTIMYCLWKSQGTSLHPWREDLLAGAVLDDNTLHISLRAEGEWEGRLAFDTKRSVENMKMPLDWPRINQFPEWYVVIPGASYKVTIGNSRRSTVYSGEALARGLDIIALSDHNSTKNAELVIELGREAGLLVLPALEICSAEEAHVLGIFGTLEDALKMQARVYESLPLLGGDGNWQVIVDSEDGVLGFESLALMGATDMPLGDIPARVREVGGLAIASHVDRGAFSITSQLGFVPEDVIFDAFEVIDPEKAEPALMMHPATPRLACSDAHRLDDVGSKHTIFMMEEPSFKELSLAIAGEGGRGLRAVYAP